MSFQVIMMTLSFAAFLIVGLTIVYFMTKPERDQKKQ